MDRVSDERLAVILQCARGALDRQSVTIYLDAIEAEMMVVELQSRRAAEREQEAQAVPAKPMWEEHIWRYTEWKLRLAQEAVVFWQAEYEAARAAVARANRKRGDLVHQAVEAAARGVV